LPTIVQSTDRASLQAEITRLHWWLDFWKEEVKAAEMPGLSYHFRSGLDLDRRNVALASAELDFLLDHLNGY
jgi:hypothetical protein